MVPVITLRVEDEVKAKLEAAMKARGGISLSAFILEAALKAADKELRSDQSTPSLGTPGMRSPSAHYKMLCEEAGRGGENGWRMVGYKMASSTEDEQLYGPVARERLRALEQAFKENAQDEIWEWYEIEFPKHIALVPLKRKYRFIEGLQGAFRDRLFKF